MSDLIISIIFGIFGAFLGSFASVIIFRLHYDQKGIFFGKSKCNFCANLLKFRDLLPIISYIIYKGRCRICKKSIDKIYILLEIIFAIVFGIFAYTFFSEYVGTLDLNDLIFTANDFSLILKFILLLLVVFLCLILLFYDGRFMEVDKRISLPAILFAIFFAKISGLSFFLIFCGGLVGGGFYLLQYLISNGKWVGAGDIELGIFLGCLFGMFKVSLCLFGAYLIGTFYVIFLLVIQNLAQVLQKFVFCKHSSCLKKLNSLKISRKTALPMGVFLMISCLIFLHSGDEIVAWYKNFFLW